MAMNKARAVQRQAASGYDCVDVRVVVQLARPGVKYERGAEGRVQVGLPEFEQSASDDTEHRVIDDSRSEDCQRTKFRGQREDDVKVLHVQHALSLLLNPLLLGKRLTFRTVPVAARVVDGLLVVAGRAVLEGTTESLGATLSDVGQHAALPRVDPLGCFELRPVSPNDVRDVEASGPCWARHE